MTFTLQKGGRAKAKILNRTITCARKYRYTHSLIYHHLIIILSYDVVVLKRYLIDLSIYCKFHLEWMAAFLFCLLCTCLLFLLHNNLTKILNLIFILTLVLNLSFIYIHRLNLLFIVSFILPLLIVFFILKIPLIFSQSHFSPSQSPTLPLSLSLFISIG